MEDYSSLYFPSSFDQAIELTNGEYRYGSFEREPGAEWHFEEYRNRDIGNIHELKNILKRVVTFKEFEMIVIPANLITRMLTVIPAAIKSGFRKMHGEVFIGDQSKLWIPKDAIPSIAICNRLEDVFTGTFWLISGLEFSTNDD